MKQGVVGQVLTLLLPPFSPLTPNCMWPEHRNSLKYGGVLFSTKIDVLLELKESHSMVSKKCT